MFPSNPSTNLLIGLTTVGLAVVATSVRLFGQRRKKDNENQIMNETETEAEPDNQPISEKSESNTPTKSGKNKYNALLQFFLIVLLLSIPFWIFGEQKLPLPVNLPISALMSFNPMIAAAILHYRRNGFRGVNALFRKVFDFRKIENGGWYLPIFFLFPLLYLLSYIVMWLFGLSLPASIEVPLQMAPAFFLLYFVAATGEELGWMGVAIDPMQKKWGALKAAVLLGAIWALWHAIPFIQTGNNANWIIWQSLGLVAHRILIVWAYNRSGKSVFAAIVLHATANVSWSLFPNYGSHYDPFITTILSFLAVAIVWRRSAANTTSTPHQSRYPSDEFDHLLM